ncbi:transcription factor E3-like [Ruditapes philippinarum]|uniref:transcription factor E3-like n=1 Tax=Ruditapes philippinarum TaxID=129788 RepID=UPI00295B9744|nr:transcription factor E3-like [Ruditapes philippinarum]
MQRLPVSSLTDPIEVRQTILNQNDKEKRRKESHNKVEKKRINVINDNIRELGNLLPEDAKRRSKQRKGLILKESVDYIKKLQKEHDVVQGLQKKIDDVYNEIEKLSTRLQQVELRMQISNNGCNCHEEKRKVCAETNEENDFSKYLF